MPSAAKENYLKALFLLGQRNESISLTDLSRELGVSIPTANNMVKKMQTKGWVKYEKYKPIKLTVRGRKEAGLIVRKHRLAEMFLSKIMGFGWEQVHDIAEEMEHLQSELFFERMDEILGFPSVDPHGSPIPDKEGKMISKKWVVLSECPTGTKVRLCAVKDTTYDLLVYLNKKNIQLGTEMNIIHIEKFDGSFTLSYGQMLSVVISKEVCQCLLVERI